MAEAKQNYTESMVETMLSMYEELGNDGIATIAAQLNRTERSVRSKLVREGVYVAQPKPAKAAKAEGPTKKELLRDLESLVSFDVGGLTGATKEAIAHVIVLAEQVSAQSERPAEDPAEE